MKQFKHKRHAIVVAMSVGLLCLTGCTGSQTSTDVQVTDKLPPDPSEIKGLVSRLDSLDAYNRYYEVIQAMERSSNLVGPPSDTIVARKAAYARAIGSLVRHVDLTTWERMRAAFKVRYDNHGGDSESNWPEDSVSIDISSFLGTADSHRPVRDYDNWNTDRKLGVIFYYGTSEDDRLTLGIEFTPLKYHDGNKLEMDYEYGKGWFYELTPGSDVLVPTDSAAWKRANWDERYEKRVLVRKADGVSYEPVDDTRHANSEAFQVETFERLCGDNSDGKGKFVVVSGCDASLAPNVVPNYHRLMIHVFNADKKRLLSDTHYEPQPFKDKALELGSLCPPRCKKVSF